MRLPGVHFAGYPERGFGSFDATDEGFGPHLGCDRRITARTPLIPCVSDMSATYSRWSSGPFFKPLQVTPDIARLGVGDDV